MKEKGYSVSIYDENDVKYTNFGGFACKKDKFSILFKLVEFPYPKSFSIHAIDRNGNFILTGETVAIYSIYGKDDLSDQEVLSRFKIALNDIYEKYKVYSKENRLDFVFNELEQEVKDYTNIEIKNSFKKSEIKDDLKSNKKKYQVKIIESSSRIVEEEADNYEEAEESVIEKYNNQEIILDYNDFDEVSYYQYPSPILKTNFNIALSYNQEEKKLSITSDDNFTKEYNNCKSYEDCMLNFKNYMNDSIELLKKQEEMEVNR